MRGVVQIAAARLQQICQPVDQFFEDAPLADYGYNNSNWRNDAADDNPSVTSEAAVNAGFFNFAEHGVRSTTFDNLVAHAARNATRLPDAVPAPAAGSIDAVFADTAFADGAFGEAGLVQTQAGGR